MTFATEIRFACPWITDEDRERVMEVLHRDVLTHGPEVAAFEDEFAKFVDGPAYCVALSSGMAALHLAYFDLGLQWGDNVLVPAQTHVATVHAIELLGARPIFIDAESKTGNIKSETLASHITPNTKAIAVVHFLGVPCDMETVLSVAKKHQLRVIEDCALALGSRYRGTHVGLIGDAGCFSFYPGKHITTGEGGMFITRHKDVAERVRKARGFGVDRAFAERALPGIYNVATLGMNYRMSDINAALGRVQLGRLPEILKRRRANFNYLKMALSHIVDIRILDADEQDDEHSFYCLSVVCLGELRSHRNTLLRKLNAAGIGTSVYYPHPVPRLTYYLEKYGYSEGDFPHAEEISDQSIALPIGPHVGPKELDIVATALQRAIEEVGHD